MSCPYFAVHGFGFSISTSDSQELFEALEEQDGYELPEGVDYTQYGYTMNNGEWGLIIYMKTDLSAILRGELPLPNVTPILEWAELYNIKFENPIPQLFVEFQV